MTEDMHKEDWISVNSSCLQEDHLEIWWQCWCWSCSHWKKKKMINHQFHLQSLYELVSLSNLTYNRMKTSHLHKLACTQIAGIMFPADLVSLLFSIDEFGYLYQYMSYFIFRVGGYLIFMSLIFSMSQHSCCHENDPIFVSINTFKYCIRIVGCVIDMCE